MTLAVIGQHGSQDDQQNDTYIFIVNTDTTTNNIHQQQAEITQRDSDRTENTMRLQHFLVINLISD